MMMHTHTGAVTGDRLYIFARLANVSCSVCAPKAMTQWMVESYADLEIPGAIGGWCAIDKSKAGMGAPSPSPCNQDPNRLHWFLVDGLTATHLGFPTKR